MFLLIPHIILKKKLRTLFITCGLTSRSIAHIMFTFTNFRRPSFSPKTMIFESSSYCYILLLLLARRSIILDMNLARDLDGFWIEELQVCNVEGRTFKSFHFITPRRERALAVERWEQYEWESLPLLPSYSILATLQS